MAISDLCTTAANSKLFVHILVLFFGAGAWVAVNGIWVELPIIVDQSPERWELASYLTLITQAGNIGPIAITLWQYFSSSNKKVVNEKIVIYVILAIGTLACFALCFVWNKTATIAGANHSLPLFVLWFFISFVDCTSSVTFLPYMKLFPAAFLTTYFIGEGLSGFIPSVFALIQGASDTECQNVSWTQGNVTVNTLYAVNNPPRYSPEIFFSLVFLMMLVCSFCFILLNVSSGARKLHIKTTNASYEMTPLPNEGSSATGAAEVMVKASDDGLLSTPTYTNKLSTASYSFCLAVIFVLTGLSNGILPALSTFTALPYGETPYHLAQALGNMANPTACIVAMLLPTTSLVSVAGVFVVTLACGIYLLTLAVLSPCPLFINQGSLGAALMVTAQVLWVGLGSYVKVSIAQIFRERGNMRSEEERGGGGGEGEEQHGGSHNRMNSLLLYGAVVQFGSMVGAFTVFPIIKAGVFKMGNHCVDACS